MTENADASTSEEVRMINESISRLLDQCWRSDSDLNEQDLLKRLDGIWHDFAGLGLTDAVPGELEDVAQVWLNLFSQLGFARCPLPVLGNALLALSALVAPATLDRNFPVAFSFGHLDGAQRCGRVSQSDQSLSGTLAFLEGCQQARQCLVVCEDGRVWLFNLADAGVRLEPAPGYAKPAYTTIHLDNVPGEMLEWESSKIDDLHLLARLLMAARAHGATQRLFELVLEYSSIREQFGKSINRYQVIQHKLANCVTTLDGTQASLSEAAAKFDRGDSGWRYAARAAHAFASAELRRTTLEIQHTFGAIGYSEEHEAPRHFRRIHADLVRFGGTNHSRRELARDLIDNKIGLPELSMGQKDIEFRQQVRAWLEDHWTSERRAAFEQVPIPQRKADKAFMQELGATGWLAMSWPEAFGGQERSAAEQLAFIEEFQMCEAPRPAGMEIQAIALMQYGTKAQQDNFLPRIRQGQVKFCLGYSEPQSGSDLASLKTSAVRDGDEWVINGEKLWTTFGDEAEYMWLAAKTDPTASPPHAGISVFIIPMNTPGLTIRPSLALYGHTFATETFENVRVPADAIVGEINQGWKVITSALATERVVMGASVAMIRANFMFLLDAIASTGIGEDGSVRDRIGELASRTEIARQLLMRCVKLTDAGEVPVYEAAMSKVFSTELMEHFAEQALDILGSAATLEAGATGALTDGRIEYLLRRSIMMVIGGGTSEIQRNLIAQRGLKLPR